MKAVQEGTMGINRAAAEINVPCTILKDIIAGS